MVQSRKTPRLACSTLDMPDISNKKIVMGFWHNWAEGEWSGSGYRQGFFKNMGLIDIPEQYNVVAVAFMKVSPGSADHIPTFTPYNQSDAEFRRQVDVLNAQGRSVLISLGGADAHIELSSGDENALVQRIIDLVETYGFDGLDIDLEQAAITAEDNQTVIPAALKRVKQFYREQGKHFIISMAPEFPYLRTGASYVPYITSLEGEYDFIAPQFYNQGTDGVWVEGFGNLKQNDNAVKEDFLYFLTHSIVTGSRGFIHIPPEKFVIGLPSNNDAADNGYVADPQAVTQALLRLEQAQLAIKGLMTWSINWDNGRPKSGEAYNWEFITRYGYVSGGETPQPQQPSTPRNFSSTAQTASSVTLNWQPSSGPHPIKHYWLYRDGKPAGQVDALTFVDKGLGPDITYSYQILAKDTQGNSSDLSPVLTVRTPGNGETDPAWINATWYADNARVSYLGHVYRCAMQHTSTLFWTPDKATSVWQRV